MCMRSRAWSTHCRDLIHSFPIPAPGCPSDLWIVFFSYRSFKTSFKNQACSLAVLFVSSLSVCYIHRYKNVSPSKFGFFSKCLVEQTYARHLFLQSACILCKFLIHLSLLDLNLADDATRCTLHRRNFESCTQGIST